MRKQIAAANWKMHLTVQQADELLKRLLSVDWTPGPHQEVVFAVPAPYLHLALVRVAESGRHGFSVVAQNCYSETSGAYTGETSALMLESMGASGVILGQILSAGVFP